MEVYVENCLKGNGQWLEVPQSRECLMRELDERHLSEDGEYQLTRIRITPFDIQECVGNLFVLNRKLYLYEKLTDEKKQEVMQYAWDEGISFEDALYAFL